jgi:hypothetical protein
MATEKKSYPRVTTTAWYQLRDRAEKSPSAKITASIVAALLEMGSEASARDNVVRGLTQMGIVDDEGALTDRGQKWRNKETYASACEEIIADVYPQDVVDIGEAGAVERWFSGQGFGASNARTMARTYQVLAQPVIPDAVDAPATKPRVAKPPVKKAAAPAKPSKPSPPDPTNQSDLPEPTLQMNVQIHLPPDATAVHLVS